MVNIVYYSNCQHLGIEYFLKKSINHGVVYHLENYSLIKKQMEIPIDIIKKANIFIYQPIDKTHGIYSTDLSVKNNIMSYLSPECKTISFPYIYNSSLWILIPPTDIDGLIGNYPDIDKYIKKRTRLSRELGQYNWAQLYRNGIGPNDEKFLDKPFKPKLQNPKIQDTTSDSGKEGCPYG
jgi:hypothetical protein